MPSASDLIRVLQRVNIASGPEIRRQLGGISAATLSRLVGEAQEDVCRLGKTRGARYALRRQVRDLGSTIAMYRMNEMGTIQSFATIHPLANDAHWVERESGGGTYFEGMPPFLADLSPQGYLGARFADNHPDLRLPQRLNDWSVDHRLIAVARRVEDGIGNLVVGEESLNRLMQYRQQGRPVPITSDEYPQMAEHALSVDVGSSAGGEHPKFVAFSGEKKAHVLVKFSAVEDNAATQRWKDLLVCEHIAMELLEREGRGESKGKGVTAPASRVLDVGSQRFLETERFDRVGSYGRYGVVTMAAFSHEYIGEGENWSITAKRMHDEGYIDTPTLNQIRWLDLFGSLIANSDRHLGNLSFFQKDPLDPKTLTGLTPVYDMLPMGLAPQFSHVAERQFTPPRPQVHNRDIWADAARAALDYWERVAQDERINEAVRNFAETASLIVDEITETAYKQGLI